MLFQEEISYEEQIAWFRSIDPSLNFYFMVASNGVDVGVCNMKQIDWDSRAGEGGIFIGNTKYQNTSVPVRAILNAATFFCDVLGIDRVNIRIVAGNDQAIHFNKMLGAVIERERDKLVEMYFTRPMFHAKTKGILGDLMKRYDEQEQTLMVEPTAEEEIGLLRALDLKRIDQSPTPILISI